MVTSFLLHTIYSKDLYYVSRKNEWFILIKLSVITESQPSLFVRGLNFFSPSRDGIKMFLLIKSKIFFIFLNNSNRKRLCLFASSHLCVFASKSHLASSLPSCLAAKNPHLSKRKSVGALPPPRRLFSIFLTYYSPFLPTNFLYKSGRFRFVRSKLC